MGRSAGTGSPVYFNCMMARKDDWRDPSRFTGHRVTLTGRTRRYRASGMLGSRSTRTSYEYVCECGHTGWSNHVDLARLAERAASP